MDTAVALVQAYLRVNGYFTVSEYPIVEAVRGGGFRSATDLDILAVRFPGAGRLISRVSKSGAAEHRFESDPLIGAPQDRVDMIIGEVKEGEAVLNAAARDPEVIRFLQDYIKEHWAVLRHEQSKDSALAFLMLIEKVF